MKFWKILSNLIDETLPDWRDKFLSYKDLKKQLKLIYPVPDEPLGRPLKRPKMSHDVAGNRTESAGEPENDWECSLAGDAENTKAVTDFVKLLEEEVDKFNGFFVEKEEEYVIRWKELQDEVAMATNQNEETKVGKEIVDFHGEMILLENYSALNYIGLVKILKKFDKRSGALLQLPFIQRVLHQPFYVTDLLDKLVRDCEAALDCLFSMNGQTALSSSRYKGTELRVLGEGADIEQMEGTYLKLTLSALRVLKDIRGRSSTVSSFSLPPLQSSMHGLA